MAPLTLALTGAIGLLMIDSIIELSFITSMVSWLHRRAGRDFSVQYDGTTFPLHGKPLHLLVDQGHTSNGAAGTAFVLIGLGGLLALYIRRFKFGNPVYYFWLVMTILSTLLTLTALIYTFVLTENHEGQTIDASVAAGLDNKPYPNMVPYPRDEWTPENWFVAVLKLPLANQGDVSDIESHLRVMRGWRWNLIPMLLLGLAVCILALVEGFVRRREQTPVVKGGKYSSVKAEEGLSVMGEQSASVKGEEQTSIRDEEEERRVSAES